MKTLSILIVEDEKLLRWALRERLRQEGYRVLEAGTGRDAIGHLEKENELDLVLLDIKLPDASGLDLLQMIRKKSPRTRVIVMTSLSSPETVRAAHDAGSHRFVEKPFELEEMVKLVGETLAGVPAN